MSKKKEIVVLVDATAGKVILKLELEYGSFKDYSYDWCEEGLEDRLCSFAGIKSKQVLIEGEIIDE